MTALALRMLLRDWRAGELRVLVIALVVAVASVTSVGFFADRMQQALTREAHQLLGADVVLVADHPWPQALRDEIARRGLRQAASTSFISMARVKDEAQLIAIKAVSDGYPLRGKLRIASGLNLPDAETDAVPRAGEVWIDERLAVAFSLAIGQRLELGNSGLRVGAILTLEPDRGASFFNFAPRLLMHLDDVPATGLVQSGSRVWYQLLAAGEREPLQAFEQWLAPRLGRGESLQSLSNARPEIRGSLERAQKFIGLTALLAVVLAAVAISLATRRYIRRHLDGYAVMRCIGATQKQLFGLFAREFAALGVTAGVIGSAAGFMGQMVITWLVAELVKVPLPQPTPLPAVQGFLVGIVLLLGFALPPLMQLKNVPALRVIRRDLGPPRERALVAYGAGLAAIAALAAWQAGEARLGLVVLGGFGAAFAVFGGVAYVALRLLGVAPAAAGLTWRYGLANLSRRVRTNTVQILALALGLTAILMLTFTRADLLDTWKAKIPADAPNRFIVNIQPEQRAPLLEFFRDHGLPAPATYPMVRGRFVARNDAPVDVDRFEDRERRLVEREFNLSYMDALPGHNQVVAGRWFTPEDLAQGALSVEEGIARSLGWQLGDRLSWQVAGQTFSAPIVNFRKLDWDSMRVNFFVIATPQLLENAATSYITSFHQPAARTRLTNQLSQRFPNMTVVDMSVLLQQAQNMLEQVVRAVQFVFLFAVGAGVLVLYAALLATQDERVQEAAVMRALGASRSQVLAAQRAEFMALGLLAGLLAAAGASAIGFLVARQVFQFSYHINHWIWLAGPLLGVACVAVNMVAGARAALSRPPMLALREA